MKGFKLIALIAVFVFAISGCKSGDTTSKTAVESNSAKKETDISVELDKVKEDILNTIEASDYIDINGDAANLLYDIELKDMKQCSGFSVANGTFPHEVVMIEAANDEAAKRIEEALDTKINSFAQQSKNYDPDNYALAKKCKLEKNGIYFGLFLSPEYEEIKTVYNKYIK